MVKHELLHNWTENSRIKKNNALSQEALAEKVGISTTHMSHIETGNEAESHCFSKPLARFRRQYR